MISEKALCVGMAGDVTSADLGASSNDKYEKYLGRSWKGFSAKCSTTLVRRS